MDSSNFFHKCQAVWLNLVCGFGVLCTEIPFIFTKWRHELNQKALAARLAQAEAAARSLPDNDLENTRIHKERVAADIALIKADSARLDEAFALRVATHQARLACCISEKPLWTAPATVHATTTHATTTQSSATETTSVDVQPDAPHNPESAPSSNPSKTEQP